MHRLSSPLGASILATLAGLAVTSAAQAAPQVPGDPDRPIELGDPEELAWEADFFPGTVHAATFPTVEELFGFPLGSRMLRSDQIRSAFRNWQARSPRIRVIEHGQTHEGRPLYHAVFARPDRLDQLEDVLEQLGQLADPRGLDEARAEELVASLPAVAWMAYSIHGDETSGADAAVALAYHLAAGNSPDVTDLFDDLIIVIDPNQNPDGRERTIGQVEQMAGYVTTVDHATMQRGRWPAGRGNHYLFDLNRDWIAGVAMETRARWEAIRRYSPQLVVDGHEMGALDTFLMYPQAAAHHPRLPGTLGTWQGRLADEMAQAFDRFGWGYYTREWADAWGPYYTDAWGSLNGAIGMLYEQSRTAGFPLRRASGEILPYREAVHGQVVASLANLKTLAANREAILRDYVAARREACEPENPARAFVIGPNAAHPERRAALIAVLDGQGIEHATVEGFELTGATDRFGAEFESLAMPTGSTIVRLAQPQGRLVSAYLDFDTRLPQDYLNKERADVERRGYGNMYDVTAWDLGHAFDLECWWGDLPNAPLSSPGSVAARPAALDPGAYAWTVDGSSDGAPRFAAAALQRGLAVHLSDRDFTAAGRTFARGSLLIRRHENELDDLADRVRAAAAQAEVEIASLGTGRSPDEGPDLGGGHFILLERPRIGLVSNAPLEPDEFGHVWHHLDARLGVEYSLLDAQTLGDYDLRRFNVLIFPPAGGARSLVAAHADQLGDWVRAGGTLIATGASAAAVASEDFGLSEVRKLADVLPDHSIYLAAAVQALTAGTTAVDVEALFEGRGAAGGEALLTTAEGDPDALERRDRWMRRFAPSGTFLRGHADDGHWITAGAGAAMSVFFTGSHALQHRGAVPVRLSQLRGLRLAGLLWPEAAERLALSAYLTVEGSGYGQVILFAANPVYRGITRGTARLFSNAVIYGPGAGASAPIPR